MRLSLQSSPPVAGLQHAARFFNDIDRLIAKNEREKPGFAAAVEKRKGELLIAARLREARENLKLTRLMGDAVNFC